MTSNRSKSSGQTVLVDFSSGKVQDWIRDQSVSCLPIPGARGLEVGMPPATPRCVVFQVPAQIRRSDWAGYQTLVLDLENRERDEITIAVSLLNASRKLEPGSGVMFTAAVPPGSRAKWRISLQPLRYTTGWWEPWGWSRQPGLGKLKFQGRMDSRRIAEVRIGQYSDGRHSRVGLYSMSLEDPIRPEGWVDRFGQRSAMRWPGKVNSDADIIRADKRESRELTKAKRPGDRDIFQAWNEGPRRKASGFFRVEEVGGRWWFIAPNGNLYYATGMDCVICGIGARLDSTVRAAYSWLPPKKGALSEAWELRRRRGGTKDEMGLNLYRANLVRKWGADGLRRKFQDRAIARQLAWGFTSIGNWSDPGLFGYRKLPYFTTGPGTGDGKVPFVAGGIQDAFHPGFEANAHAGAASLARFKFDPWCVGHFTFNEIKWDQFPATVLAGAANLPARVEWLKRLKRKYRTIGNLNSAWGTRARSFTDLRWPGATTKTNVNAENDLAAFRGEFANRFYRVWNRAVRSADPNHLVLGSRIHGGNKTAEVIAASARHMDVVSFNVYHTVPWKGEFDRYYAIAKKPFIIGEYGHNSLDTGLLTASVPVADQAARGVGYRYYTEQLAAMPYFVGGHFFQYLDEPITGRFDRETSFNGFVNIADVPHPHIVRAAKATHARIYRVHAGKSRPFSIPPKL